MHEANPRKEGTLSDIPNEMREFAEKSVEQARKAFDGFAGAAHRTVEKVEASAEAAQAGFRDVGHMTIGFAEANITASLDFAQQLLKARDLGEVMRLQSDFIQRQMSAMQGQASELGKMISAGLAPDRAGK